MDDIKYCNRLSCDNCPSYCGDCSVFKLHTYPKGEEYILSTDKNYLIFVLSGSLKISLEDIGDFFCSKDDTFLLQKNCNYYVEALEDCEILAVAFIQAYQMCDNVKIDNIKDFLANYEYKFHTIKMVEVVRDIVYSMIKYLKDDINCVYIHNAKQLELLVAYKFYYSEREIMEFFFPLINPKMYFQSLVKLNNHKAKSVEELSILCGYNVHSFKKAFKENMNMSPYQWMLEQKKYTILELLLDSTIPIKAVASQSGFTSQSHLNRYCNRFLGGTSSQIRGGKSGVKNKKL